MTNERIDLKNWKEMISDPKTGREIMSDYGNVIEIIEQLLKQKDEEFAKDLELAYKIGRATDVTSYNDEAIHELLEDWDRLKSKYNSRE